MNGMPTDGTEELLRVRGVHTRMVTVCQRHRVALLEVLGMSRSASVVKARGHAAYELRKLGFSWPEVGELLGRHQATVHSAADSHAKRAGLEKL